MTVDIVRGRTKTRQWPNRPSSGRNY